MRMKSSLAMCILAMAVAVAVAPPADAARSDWRAGDLIVVGWTSTLKYEVLDDLGMNGEITARLHITRMIRGRSPASTLTIKYVAHSPWRDHVPMRLHLSRAADGSWHVCNDGRARGFICRERR